ncbi:MAG: AbrB/MazE/SpoVT family DNA-binding domain-containing protein [Paramuribaculum sp.]|nr:AbrB/MazE/SpoVT family DNA-binding domain-containing protein [Paramuribaculum sp.]
MPSILQNIRRRDITFYRDGRINLTARISKTLGLKPGDSIDIITEGGEYYLHAIHHGLAVGHGVAQCRQARPDSPSLYVNSIALCRAMFLAIGFDGDKAAFAVGPAIIKNTKPYLPIITRMLL